MKQLPVLSIALFALASALGTASRAQAQNIQEIIDGHIEALGGWEAINGVESIQRSGRVRRTGSGGEMSGTIRLILIPGKKAYQEIDTGDFAVTMGWNGVTGWSRSSAGGLQKLQGGGLNQIRSQASLDPLIDLRRNPQDFSDVRVLPDESLDGLAHHVIQYVAPEGELPIKAYISKETRLLTRVRLEQSNPSGGAFVVLLINADFRSHGGIVLPDRMEMKVGAGMMNLEYVYDRTIVNGELDENVFEMPAR